MSRATIRGSQGDEVVAAAAPTTSGRRCGHHAVRAKVAKFLDLKRLHVSCFPPRPRSVAFAD